MKREPVTRNNPLHLIVRPRQNTGYGSFSFHLTDQLVRLGMPVRIRLMNDFDPPPSWRHLVVRDAATPFMWSLVVGPPDLIQIDPTRAAMAFTMWESGRLDPQTARMLSTAPLLAVPNEWSIVTFDAAGVTAPMRLVHLGYDPAAFRDLGVRPEACVFGTAASLAGGGIRKNVQQTVDAFLKAFPRTPDVRLRIKLGQEDPEDAVFCSDSRIEVQRASLPAETMNAWYNSLTAFVTTSYAEGWGQHNVEAMACGRPVIGCRFGGHAEYLDDTVGYCTDYDLRPAAIRNYRGLWAVPRTESVVAAMQAVYRNRQEAETRGQAGKRRATALTWEATARNLMEVFRQEGVWTGEQSRPNQLTRPVTVVFLAWNQASHTARMLDSLNRTLPFGAELLAVDNGSTDATPELLRGHRIRTITNPTNRGFGAAVNQAIAATDGDIVLLNNDCLPDEPGWLDELQSVAYATDDVALVGCRHRDGRGGVMHTGSRLLPNHEGMDINYPIDLNQGVMVRDSAFVSFACVYIPRRTIERVGTLDERYFAYYEDCDYCIRCRDAGLRVVYNGQVNITHEGNATSSKMEGGTAGLLAQSRKKFVDKWGGRLTNGPRIAWKVDCVTDDAQRHLRDLITALHDRGAVQEVSLRCPTGPLAEDPVVSRMLVKDVRPGGTQIVYGPPSAWYCNTGERRIGFLPDHGVPGRRAAAHCPEVWRWGHEVGIAADQDICHPNATVDAMSSRPTILACPEGPWENAALLDLAAAFGPLRGKAELAVLPYSGFAVRLPSYARMLTRVVPWWARGCLFRSVTGTAVLLSEFPAVESWACDTPVFRRGDGWAEALARQPKRERPPTTWSEVADGVLSRLSR